MSDQIVVTVVSFNRKFWYMRYKNPLTGKIVAKSTGIECTPLKKKEALKVAAKWEAELQEGRFKSPTKISWAEFRHRYEDERMVCMAPKTIKKVMGVFNSIEELLGIDKLAKLNTDQLSRLMKLLRSERKQAEITIKHNMAHLMAALKWAARVGMLHTVPEIEMPKRATGAKLMKGRPITLEEFERMLVQVPAVLFPPRDPNCPIKKHARTSPPTPEELARAADLVQRWEWFLRGLWFSGLRLGEALDLSWDEPGHIQPDFSGQYAMFDIPADKQKSGKAQLLPIAPEFSEMLRAVPQDQRQGPVFKLGRRDTTGRIQTLFVSKTICKMGQKANVVVNQQPKKFASAHDFRRSFGERWSTRVMPAVLQQMMRHSDIATTMRFYVGQNGQKAAAEMFAGFLRSVSSNTSSNTSPHQPEPTNQESTQPIDSKQD